MAIEFPQLSIRLKTRRWVLLLIADAVVTVCGFLLALLLRFDRIEVGQMRADLYLPLICLVASRVTLNFLLGLDLWSFMRSGLPDGFRLCLAGVGGTGVFVTALVFGDIGKVADLGRAVLVLELLLSTSMMAFVRFAPRLGRIYQRQKGAERTIIVGAGDEGESLLRDLQRSGNRKYRVVGFVDDETKTVVGGKAVLGDLSDLPGLIERHGIEHLLIAVPRLPAIRVQELVDVSSRFGLSSLIVPFKYDGPVRLEALEKVSLSDFLERPEIEFKAEDFLEHVEGSTLMVTGAAGTVGSELCSQLLECNPERLVLVDIDENDLYMLDRRLEQRFNEKKWVIELGDVRDEPRIRQIFLRYRPRDVFYAAGRKHVHLMEAFPAEAVKTNVLGAFNVAKAASDHGAERFLYVSTDKAADPIGVMGASKRLAEMLLRQLGEQSSTRYLAVRFGNILNSNGSVVPVFRQQIKKGGPVTVTDREMTRFMMTISEACLLILTATYREAGHLCILDMGRQIRIDTLARNMIKIAKKKAVENEAKSDDEIQVAYTGLRPGEKLVEALLGEGETVTRRIHEMIKVVESPPAATNLVGEIERMNAVANSGDGEAVKTLLQELVPEYKAVVDPESVGLQEYVGNATADAVRV